MSIELEEVISAIQNAEDGIAFYYWPQREMIIFDDEETPDEEVPPGFDFHDAHNGLIPLPGRSTARDYERMKQFAEESIGQRKEWLGNAIRGAGAFHRFRAVLERFDSVEEWRAFQERCDRLLAMDWCEENGVPYHMEEKEAEVSALPKKPADVKPTCRIVRIGKKNAAPAAVLKAPAAGSLEAALAEIDALLQSGGILFAASQNGRYIGYLQIEDGNVATDIYVVENKRRMKIGTALVAGGEAECGALCVHVPCGNESALAFFRALGYDRQTFIALTKTDAAS